MANMSSLVVKLEAKVDSFKQNIASARDILKRTAKDSKKATDDMADGLSDAAKAAGIYRDEKGKLREANGRFVKTERMAELGVSNWNTAAKKASTSSKGLSFSILKLNANMMNLSSISKKLPSIKTVMSSIAKAAAAGLAAVTGFFAAMTVKAGSIKELDSLSRSVGVSVTELQKWNFAAKSVGLESDKMGDIFKDTADKMGDFLATGGGEAADLFEKLNLNAAEFIGLAPDKALLKIGQAIEPLTQEQKVFFMEAIADEASRLVPLLENNASGFRRLADQAQRTGNVLDEKGVKAAVRFRNSWNDLISTFNGFLTQLTAAMAPALDVIINKFIEWRDKQGGVAEAAKTTAKFIISGIRSGVSGAAQMVRALGNIEIGWKSIQRAILAVGEGAAEVINFFTPSVWAQKFGVNISDTAVQKFEQNLEGAKGMLDEQIAKLRSEGTPQWAQSISNMLDELEQSLNKVSGGLGVKGPVDDNTQATRDNTRSQNALSKYIQDNSRKLSESRNVFGTGEFGSINTDKIFGAKKTGSMTSSRVFESVAKTFADSIKSGSITSRTATTSIADLRKIVAQLSLENVTERSSFDIQGMNNVIGKLAEMAQAQLSGENKPITLDDYKNVFEAAAEKGRQATMQSAEKIVGAIRDNGLSIGTARGVSGADGKRYGTLRLELRSGDKGTEAVEILATPEAERIVRRYVVQNTQNSARAAAQ